MKSVLALSLLAGACLEPAPDEPAGAPADASVSLWTVDAAPFTYSPEVLDTAGRSSYGVRVGPELVLVSSRVLGAGPAGSTLQLDGAAEPSGWYVNAHPAGAMLLVQRDPRDLAMRHAESTIDTAASFAGNLRCSPDGFGYVEVPVQTTTSATITSASTAPATALGAPCWSSDRVFIGFIDSIDAAANLTTVARAAPLVGWIARMNELASVRMDARIGGRGVSGPYAMYVEPAADPSRRMCLDVPGSAVNAQVTINQWPCHQGKNQQFFVDLRVDATRPRLISNQSGLCVDVRGAATTAGTELQQYGCHTNLNQLFTRESPPTVSIPPRHRYRPRHAPNLCVAARSGNDAFGGGLSIRQMACAAQMAAHELWKLQLVAAS